MFPLPISMRRFKRNNFYQNSPNIKLFLQKKVKFLNTGTPLPNHRASGGWGFAPRLPEQPPIAKYMATRLASMISSSKSIAKFSKLVF